MPSYRQPSPPSVPFHLVTSFPSPTGTANGGSALMWASMLELSRPGRGRVLTMDMNAPSSAAAGWAGANAKDPTKNPLWAKYVKFLQVGEGGYRGRTAAQGVEREPVGLRQGAAGV